MYLKIYNFGFIISKLASMKKKFIPLFIIAVFVIAIYSCKKSGSSASGGTESLDLPAKIAQYYAVPYTANSVNEKATLGRVLFYDSHLSLNNSISCGSCHKQSFAFSDNMQFSRGYESILTRRNSPPIQNLNNQQNFIDTFNIGSVESDTTFRAGSLLFWDGRENNVQNLITRPVTNHVEMGIEDLSVLPQKLATMPYYAKLFTAAYGSPEITVTKIANAVAVFISSINTGNSRYELYTHGAGTLTALELEGMNLFVTKYTCNGCHQTLSQGGYSSSDFMDDGLDASYTDLGMGALTGLASDNGKFKASKLHNIGLTAPYMHDGRFTTLDQVLEHYSHGIQNSPNLDPRLASNNNMVVDSTGNFMTSPTNQPIKQPLRMNISTQEKQALIAFLNSLTDYKMTTDPKFSNPFIIK